MATQSYTGDGVTTEFLFPMGATNVSATVAGAFAYMLSQGPNFIVFDTAPANGAAVVITYTLASNVPVLSNVDPLTGGISFGDNSRGVGNLVAGVTFPETFPTLAVGVAGALTGYYGYYVTFYTAAGETDTTTATPTPIQVTAQKINLSNIPVSADSSVIGRRIYRTPNVGTPTDITLIRQAYFVADIADNTTTTYTDNLIDATLLTHAGMPGVNTTVPYFYRGTTKLAQLLGNCFSVGAGALQTGSGYACTAIGYNALNVNVAGGRNVAIGTYALASNTTGYENTAIGVHSLNYSTTGAQQVAIGFGALEHSATASTNPNVAIGSYSLYNHNSANGGNTGIGHSALQGLTSGYNNTCLGFTAGWTMTTGADNVFIGYQTGYATEGNFNVGVGMYNLSTAGSKSGNTAIGYQSLTSLTTGSSNVALGYFSGNYATTTGNELFVNNQDRTNYAGDQTLSLLYGVFAATAAAQRLTVNALFKTLTTTVALLPSASGLAGFRAFVTDATATTFASTVAGGGANNVPVYSDGTNWKIG